MNQEPNRRKFLQTGITLGTLLPLLGRSLSSLAQKPQPAAAESAKALQPLSILVLGGTSFLGPQQIAYALQRGHRISTFTRGRTQPKVQKDIFDEVEQLIGDRENDLEALKNRRWDVVIDNSGNRIKWVKDAVALLKNSCGLYLYTSSTGVYYPYLGQNIRENTKLVLKVPEGITSVQKLEYDYGVMKSLNEIEVMNGFGKERAIIVRPTYMIGPGDQTDRFTYWPERIALGGEILVPGKADDPVQYIDVRDVAGFMIRLAENHKAGIYNAVGPPSATGMQAFVYGVHAAFNSRASFVMIPDYDFLTKHKVLDAIPWIMPIGDNLGSARLDLSFSVANGLTFTPLAETVRDIHEWWNSEAVPEEKRRKLLAGPASLATREPEILAAWKARR
ncbi:NAD-dependent epimerase/dehydratase family protein [Salmonirosea aquatica]|uniref:NAD-dependent epimerase/dehydratase family protein n=1 Tax=Salmonirosea aquatica TaxID=2654236 RepID=A0A7C9F8A4_9BACT|nr:NAD-dependent epimerase/dehydratase family protein [Cytophagaceae bacterium SJW1-29]